MFSLSFSIYFKKTLVSHFELVKQKDNLIINLRTKSSELSASLTESNELIRTQQNQMKAVYKDINYVRGLNKELVDIIHQEKLTCEIKATEAIENLISEMEIKANSDESLLIENLKIELTNLKEKLKEKDATVRVSVVFDFLFIEDFIF